MWCTATTRLRVESMARQRLACCESPRSIRNTAETPTELGACGCVARSRGWSMRTLPSRPCWRKIALEERECAPARLHVIANGIDASRFTPQPEARRRTRAELGIPESAWQVVGTVGRLSPEKDQALLVDAMAPLLDAFPAPARDRGSMAPSAASPLSLRVAATWRAQYVHMTGARSDAEKSVGRLRRLRAHVAQREGLPPRTLGGNGHGPAGRQHGRGRSSRIWCSTASRGFLVEPRDRAALSERFEWLSSRPAAALAGSRGGPARSARSATPCSAWPETTRRCTEGASSPCACGQSRTGRAREAPRD